MKFSTEAATNPYNTELAVRRAQETLRSSNGYDPSTLNPDNLQARFIVPQHEDYALQMRQAFSFLRRCRSGRYSDSAVVSVLNAADRADGLMAGPPQEPGAILITLGEEPSYDEDTESKRGGTWGLLVQTNGEQGRALLAVHPNLRRRGIARALMQMHEYTLGSPVYWVGNSNREAQMLLLSEDYRPLQMNSTGAIMYARFEEEEVL